MGIYRVVSQFFWTDSKIDDDFTPEDKYFYLYLLTNPHTNICGCYEISMKQMCRETGYNEDTINRLIKRMERQHDVIRYDAKTKEILIIKWGKYNWYESEKTKIGVKKIAKFIKSDKFRTFIEKAVDTPSMGYAYPIDTSVSVSVTVTDSVTGTELNETDSKKKKEVKHKYGEYQNVLLTDREYSKLMDDFGNQMRQAAIQYMDEYIEDKGYKSKSHYLAIRRWVIDAVKEQNRKTGTPSSGQKSWEDIAAEWEEENE